MFYAKDCIGEKKQAEHLLVLSLVISIILIGPLSVPVLSNMIVVMDSDDTIDTAAGVLRENIPNAIMVEYGSLEYHLTIQRVAGAVIWLSHGSEDGILTKGQVSSWMEFSNLISLTPSVDIVLACESEHIYDYASSQEVFGFRGPVEATIGALLVSAAITGICLNEIAHSVVQSILAGSFNPQWLILTMEEFVWATFNFALQTLFIGTGFFITEAMLLAVYNLTIALFIDTFIIAGAVAGGYASPTDLILPLIALLGGIVLAIAVLYPQYAALMAASAALLSSPFGYFLIALNIGIYIANLVMEYND